MTYGYIRQALEHHPDGEINTDYRWLDSAQRLGITHKPTNTKLRAVGSNAKGSFGLVRVPLVCVDEPGSLEIVGGSMLYDSLSTALGKTGSRLKLVICGTLAPMASSPGHWFYDLVHGGSVGKRWVKLFEGNRSSWDSWHTIRKANPLVMVDPNTREKLLGGAGSGTAGFPRQGQIPVIQIESSDCRRIRNPVDRRGVGEPEGTASATAERRPDRGP